MATAAVALAASWAYRDALFATHRAAWPMKALDLLSQSRFSGVAFGIKDVVGAFELRSTFELNQLKSGLPPLIGDDQQKPQNADRARAFQDAPDAQGQALYSDVKLHFGGQPN